MFKNMKLSAKLGVGFGSLIVIAVTLGAVAVWRMWEVQGNSTMLASEYVPEVDVANDIERTSQQTMYEMRGYGLSEDEKYLTKGRENIAQLSKHLDEAKALADKSAHLVKLNAAVGDLQAAVAEYKNLVDETVARNQAIAENRKSLDAAAAGYLQSCGEFLENQTGKMKHELAGASGGAAANADAAAAAHQERLEKISLINHVIDQSNQVRVACFKAQAKRDPQIIKDTEKDFDAIASDLEARARLRVTRRTWSESKRRGKACSPTRRRWTTS